MTLTPEKLAANHANAQLSTGPCTPEGKARASRNALRTGLTGVTVLLPTDDADRYASFCQRFEKEYQPEGDEERELVQAIIDTRWRLNRVPQLIYSLEAQGRDEYFDLNPTAGDGAYESTRALSFALTRYSKQINSLYSHEARLARQLQRLKVELKDCQTHRRSREKRAAMAAAAAEPQPAPASEPSTPQPITAAIKQKFSWPPKRIIGTSTPALGSNFEKSPDNPEKQKS